MTELLFVSVGRALVPATLFLLGFSVLRLGLRRCGKSIRISTIHAFVGPAIAMVLLEVLVFRPATGLIVIPALVMATIGVVLVVASVFRRTREPSDSGITE